MSKLRSQGTRKRESYLLRMEDKGRRRKGKEQEAFPSLRKSRKRSPPDGSHATVANMVTMEVLKKMEKILESKLQQNNENLESKWESKWELMYKALKQATKGTCISQTPAELGLLVKEMAEVRFDCVPVPVDKRLAARIWGSRDVWNSLDDPKSRILEENFNNMLLKVKWDQCKQEMVFTGHEREELSDQKQIDYTIYVKGKRRVASNVTGLVSLYSFPDPGKYSKRPKYHCKAHVGHAIRRAIAVLRSAGPARTKIAVAVSNLRCIQWYTVEEVWSGDVGDITYLYCRTPEIDSAKRSLAAVFLADPSHLFCQQSDKYVIDGHELEFLDYLGSEATSTVYRAHYLDKDLVVKVSKREFDVSHEKEILELLKGVPGVPSVVGVASDLKSLLILPVGEKVRGSVPLEARENFANVIDTLREAHERKIVHRDVRMGNIVLFDQSFLLINWGFACRVGDPAVFCGSLLTTSSSVIKDYGKPVLYMPKDDLVSFVKCLFLLSHPSEARHMRHAQCSSQFRLSQSQVLLQPEKLADYWDLMLGKASAWLEPLKYAEALGYDELKIWVAHWAVNFCP